MSSPRRFGTIRTLPSGRFQARYSHLGKQVAADTTFKTKAEARRWLSSHETDLARGDHVDPDAGTEMFGAYARRWLDERNVRPRTREVYASQLDRILDPFEPVPLRDISPSDVRTWHGRLLKTNLSPNSVAKIYRLFRTIMSTAVEDLSLIHISEPTRPFTLSRMPSSA